MPRVVPTRMGDEHRLVFFCPGCDSHHAVRIPPTPHAWAWNGDVERPTITPSIKVSYGDERLCHSFVTNGEIRFLPDSTHQRAGATVDLPPCAWDE